jgi:hypothetical protein
MQARGTADEHKAAYAIYLTAILSSSGSITLM